jgi:gamma-glutamyltranspeptidase/glutathione hydrolase
MAYTERNAARVRMIFPIAHIIRLLGQPRRRPVFRQITLSAVLSLLLLGSLAGCNSANLRSDSSVQGYVKGFEGAIAGDEPQAVLVGRNILAAGGSAADAAVAAYFTMSVTLPSAASLGSGGACLIYDRVKKTVESLIFTHPTSGPLAQIPLPASPRGMLALHAKYGVLPWNQLLGPAEGLARLGTPASRAFARALQAVPAAVQNPSMAAIFAGKSGNPVAQGALIQQFALAGTLSAIRRQPRQIYAGKLIKRIAEGYQRAGVRLTADDIRNNVPKFRPPVKVTRGNHDAFFPPTPAGIVSAQAWAMLYRERAWTRADKAEQPHVLAEVSKRAYADAGRWFRAPGGVIDPAQPIVDAARIEALLKNYQSARAVPVTVAGGAAVPEPLDQGSASLIVADVLGQAVACAFTMNGVMGMGRLAEETGIVIAAPSNVTGRGVPALGLMALGLGSQWQLEFLAAGTGGGAVPVTLAADAARMLADRPGAEVLNNGPRLYHPANPNRVVIEARPDTQAMISGLRAKGHAVVTTPALGRINLFICPAGFEGNSSQCDVRADRRAFGLAQQN